MPRVIARRHTHDALEVSREVALIAKAGIRCDISNCVSIPQQSSSPTDTQLQLVFMWRDAEVLSKRAQQMKRAEARDAGQFRKRHAAGILCPEIVARRDEVTA